MTQTRTQVRSEPRNTQPEPRTSYDDIINLPHPTSQKHPRMSMETRAAQFSPFAALTGHEAAVKETARLTETRHDLDEDELTVLNEKLQYLCSRLQQTGEKPPVSITYFVPDGRKDGGAYETADTPIRRLDEYRHELILTDGTVISIEQISDIKSSLFDDIFDGNFDGSFDTVFD